MPNHFNDLLIYFLLYLFIHSEKTDRARKGVSGGFCGISRDLFVSTVPICAYRVPPKA